MSDPYWYIDGELDDVSPEERAALAKEAAEEQREEDEAVERHQENAYDWPAE